MIYKNKNLIFLALSISFYTNSCFLFKEIYTYLNNKNFIHAAQIGDIKSLEKFLKNGFDINATNDNQCALNEAIYYNKKNTILFLIENGADVNLKNSANKTPLDFAIDKNDSEIVKILINNGAKITNSNSRMSPLIYACVKSKTDIVKTLIESGSNIDEKIYLDESPITLACEDGYTEIVKLLIDAGADINTQAFLDWTPLMKAVKYRHLEVVKLLLSNPKININIKNYERLTAYNIAVEEHYPEIVNIFKEKINEFKKEIYEAIRLQNLDLFKYYLLKIGSICIKDKNGNNMLHYAIKSGNLELVKFIISIKPELIWQKNKLGEVPLSYICFSQEMTNFFYNLTI